MPGYFKLILFLVIPLLLVGKIRAQEATSASVAISVDLDVEGLLDGDIICTSGEGPRKCDSEYHVGTLGVYSENPAVVIENTTLLNGKPIISSGKAFVRVTNINGQIRTGDFVTTSSVLGAGQLADKSGNVLGVALEPFTNTESGAEGKILVSIGIRPAIVATSARSNLVESLKLALLAPTLK